MRIKRGIVVGIFGILAFIGAGCSKQATLQRESGSPQVNEPMVETSTNQDAAVVERSDQEAAEAIFGASEKKFQQIFHQMFLGSRVLRLSARKR